MIAIDSKMWIKKYGKVRRAIFDHLQSRTTDNLPPDIQEVCLLSFRRGKAIRGILSFMTYMMLNHSNLPFNKKIHNAIVCGAVPEAYHISSLIQDDLIDQSDLRRGEPTVWAKYNPYTAVIAADIWAFSNVVDDFLFIPPPTRAAAVAREVREAGMAMSMGEMKDALETSNPDTVPNEKKQRSGVEEYYQIISGKTLPLIRASVTAPAMCTMATDMQLLRLRHYVNHVGYAFQIRDDLIDIIGNEKEAMKDLRKNVEIGSNYVLSLYQDEFGELPQEDIDLLKEDQLSDKMEFCVEETQKTIENHIETAIKYLENFENNKYRKGLEDTAIFCGTRER